MTIQVFLKRNWIPKKYFNKLKPRKMRENFTLKPRILKSLKDIDIVNGILVKKLK